MKALHATVCSIILLLALCSTAAAWPDGGPMLRGALFVQNRAGAELQDKLDPLRDLIAARLTEKGFSVLDRNDVVARFQESRENDGELRRGIRILRELLREGKSEAAVEDTITGASALRVAQMIGADYLIIATITSLGTERAKFTGEGTIYGTDNEATTKTLRITLKVLEGNQGGTVYGDVVTATERVAGVRNLKLDSTETLNRLLDAAAVQVAENVAGKVERIRTVEVKTLPVVDFTITSNVEAVVELDGAVIGSSPGRFSAAPGLHRLMITRQWLSTWEKTVNIAPNQTLNVTLELTEEGAQRYQDIERFRAELAREKQLAEMEMKEREAAIGNAGELSGADAYGKKENSEGEGREEEESLERFEGDKSIINYDRQGERI